jgi:hypothetical protein
MPPIRPRFERRKGSSPVEAEPDFIRIETERLCAAALAEVAQHVRSARQQPVHWLWALVALKLALQTFIVASFGSAALLEAIKPELVSRFLRVLKVVGNIPHSACVTSLISTPMRRRDTTGGQKPMSMRQWIVLASLETTSSTSYPGHGR